MKLRVGRAGAHWLVCAVGEVTGPGELGGHQVLDIVRLEFFWGEAGVGNWNWDGNWNFGSL